MSTTERKKRKWDVIGDAEQQQQQQPPQPPVVVKQALPEISETLQPATQKVQKIPPPEKFEEIIEINDLPQRFILTKGVVHSKIAEETGATVITRGVYKPPHSTTDERALHLYIEAPSQESLNKAVEAINKIIKEPKQTPQSAFTCKIMTNVPPGMELKAKGKILGPRGQYIKYIEQKANVKVQLRGIGSGYKEGPTFIESDDPLHLFISAYNEEALNSAKAQAQSLLDHAMKEILKPTPVVVQIPDQYQQNYRSYSSYPPPMSSVPHPPAPSYYYQPPPPSDDNYGVTYPPPPSLSGSHIPPPPPPVANQPPPPPPEPYPSYPLKSKIDHDQSGYSYGPVYPTYSTENLPTENPQSVVSKSLKKTYPTPTNIYHPPSNPVYPHVVDNQYKTKENQNYYSQTNDHHFVGSQNQNPPPPPPPSQQDNVPFWQYRGDSAPPTAVFNEVDKLQTKLSSKKNDKEAKFNDFLQDIGVAKK